MKQMERNLCLDIKTGEGLCVTMCSAQDKRYDRYATIKGVSLRSGLHGKRCHKTMVTILKREKNENKP